MDTKEKMTTALTQNNDQFQSPINTIMPRYITLLFSIACGMLWRIYTSLILYLILYQMRLRSTIQLLVSLLRLLKFVMHSDYFY